MSHASANLSMTINDNLRLIMIIFLYGPDTYRSRQKLNFYKDGFIQKYDPSSFNITKLDGENLTFEEINKAIATPPLFASKRMVIIENLITKNKDVSRETIPLLDNQINNENVIIFWEGFNDKKIATEPLFKRLVKEKIVGEFKLLSEKELTAWVKKEFKKEGGKIDEEAIRALIGLVGDDLWQMIQEIRKLVAFRGSKSITSPDVLSLVKGKFDDDIFKLTDALAHKNKKSFLKLLDDQFSSGANEIYLLTMLIRLFRILLETKEVSQKNRYLSRYNIAKELGLNPFVAEKAMHQIKNYSLQELKNIYHKLLEIDFKTKTGQAKPRLLFELLAVEI
jgi:DNA polymerase-3 subunit delta